MIQSSHHVALVAVTLAAFLLYHIGFHWMAGACVAVLFPWEYFGQVCEEHVAPAVISFAAGLRKPKSATEELEELGKR